MAVSARGGWISLSWIIAMLVLIAVFVLALIGKMDYLEAILFGALALCWIVSPWRASS